MSNISEFIIENGVLVKYTGTEKEVIIPYGITGIGDYAFYENVKLERITLPESVTVIGSSAFELCRKLESINLPKSLTQIGARAFRLCRKLKSIEIPGSCQSTGEVTFFGCSALETVILGEGIKKIGGYSFVNCTELKQINWPQSLEIISHAAFNSCTSLPELVLPENIHTIMASAFGDCTSVKRLLLPQAVQDSIDAKWFRSRFNNVDLNYLCLSGNTNFDKRVEDLCAKSILRRKDEYATLIIRKNDALAMANFLALQKKVDIDIWDRYISDSTEVGAEAVSAVLLEYKNQKFSFADVTKAAEIKTEKELGIKEYTVADWRKIFKFCTSDGDTTITGYKGDQTSVLIPAKIGKNRVVSFSLGIKKGWKVENAEICKKITDITIEPGVLGIGKDVFIDCKALEEIYIPASVTKISSCILSSVCHKLTIHAPAGSYAEQYAKENNISFVAE